MKRPQMEPCSNCGGFGLLMNGLDVVDCGECWGGMVVARDEKGRFLPWIETETKDVTDAASQ